MSSKLFICDPFSNYGLNGIIDLVDNTIKAALVTSSPVSTYSAWTVDTAYIVGDIVVPTADNGHRYICTVAGQSHETIEPTWPIIDEATVVDDEVTWQEYGGALADLEIWGDVSANEVANGNGYTTGGAEITTKSLTTTGMITIWNGDDVTWLALTKIFRYAFIYKVGTVGAIVNPLIGYVLFDDTPADVNITATDFTLRWNASGILQVTR